MSMYLKQSTKTDNIRNKSKNKVCSAKLDHFHGGLCLRSSGVTSHLEKDKHDKDFLTS